MENKYLQVRKENIFTRFINFFRKVFYKEQINIEDTINNRTDNTKNNFLYEIKIEHEEDPNLINLQEQFENKEIDLASMSDEEVHNLNQLYKRQIEELKKKLENKKTEINIVKNRMQSYSTNN